jgi:hypothetical protein
MVEPLFSSGEMPLEILDPPDKLYILHGEIR